jgi:hypothetical protein
LNSIEGLKIHLLRLIQTWSGFRPADITEDIGALFPAMELLEHGVNTIIYLYTVMRFITERKLYFT